MTYSEKAQQLKTQTAYEARVQARGIDALLAPYTWEIPAQRTESVSDRP